jgi:alkaline phosphatase
VTINGRDAATVFSKKPAIDANEEGRGHTAYWLRDVGLSAPGHYEVTASAGNASQTVRWEAFGTPERRAQRHSLHR